MSMDVTAREAEAPRAGAATRKSPSSRGARRIFVAIAALSLGAAGSVAPATAGTLNSSEDGKPAGKSAEQRARQGSPDFGLDSGDCKFGGDNIKSTPWSLQRVLLDELWSEATGKGVTVAVIDTGVDKRNPQIRPALTGPGKDFVGKSNGTKDVNGHGTRVAGIIAAQKAKGTGFSGIAPDAEILPIRYTGGEDPEKQGNAETMADAIKYAVAKGADIINISSDTVKKKSDDVLAAAVRYAVSKNKLVVAAAGNDGADGKHERTYPASYDGVLAVGASDRNNERAFFSQSGDFVDVAAPGVGMVSTVPKGGQCPADGTSFSAPYVAGVAALMYEKYPDWDAQEVAARIAQTANRPGMKPDPEIGWGVVDPVAALTGDDEPQSKPVPDKPKQNRHVTPMTLTVGESKTERTQRLSVYVVASGTVLTLLIGGTAIAVRDHRRKHSLAGANDDRGSSART
jgi:membrane-anchored mycosin MYCP